MWYFVSTIVPIAFNFFAVATGLVIFKDLGITYRIVVVNLLIGLIVELAGNHIKGNNSWLFNLLLPFDSSLSILAGYFLIFQQKYLPFFVIAILCLWVIWVFSIYDTGINTFSSISFAANAIIIIVEYLVILYMQSFRFSTSLLKMPPFWLCTGTILFYSCNIPVFSILNIINSKLSLIELHYLVGLVIFISVLSYLQITYSFFLFYKRQ